MDPFWTVEWSCSASLDADIQVPDRGSQVPDPWSSSLLEGFSVDLDTLATVGFQHRLLVWPKDLLPNEELHSM